MFYELIKKICDRWYLSSDCKIKNIIDYIVSKDKLRDAQVESIKMYLFFKIYCKNLPLERLFIEGYFLQNIDLDELPISKKLNDFLCENKAARQLYEIALTNNYDDLKKEIENKYLKIDFEKFFKDFFHNITYANYIYSLPMGAGKTYLMAAFIYFNLYFAINEPENKVFAHNFIVLAPSGLKSSILPSLKKIKDFDVTWIFPDPIASKLKKILKFEILDEVKTAKKSNKIKNPNVAKIAQYQPYEDMFGVILLTNAEKVILNKMEVNDEQVKMNFETGDLEWKVANELRETIGKIPNLAVFIDEVHHVADEEIKLNKVVTNWNNSGDVNEVVGFSGTPYLDKPETFYITDKFSIKNSDISNTIYYYPLVRGIDNFLKRPKIVASSDNNSLNIIKEGLTEFFKAYKDLSYDGVISKVAIYCGNIKKLEETVFPFVAEFVSDLGMDPDEVILKYHRGNKDYKIPKENSLEYESLNTKLSKKRIVLLVDIGKEGWDCSSLTGVILSQKGDCKTKMVLQTACRCLRQVIKGNHETALIYLNKENEKLLSDQLKKAQHITLKEFQDGEKRENLVKRISRMKYLDLPEIEYYKLNISYLEEIKEEVNTLKDLKKILKEDLIKQDVIITEKNINDEVIETNVNDVVYGEDITYTKWLFNISKESFGFVTIDMLSKYDDELKKIFNKITIDGKLNMTYNHKIINSLIRQSFYDKRKMSIKKEEIPESSKILSITNIPDVDLEDKSLQYPSDEITKEILDRDLDKKVNLEELTKEEILELAKNNPELFTSSVKDDECLELNKKNRTFHYIPYVFLQSRYEKKFLEAVLSLKRLDSDNLEIYYNGDKNIASFRIECFKTENKVVKNVGMYTPDFLVIRRDNKKKIDKILIIETKGKGYIDQEEFKDRRNYVENEFIKFNNKKFGYKKFDYLVVDDGLEKDKIKSEVNKKLHEFFKEEK